MGKITYYYSAMSGGKTIDLIMTAKKYEDAGFKIVIVKPTTDTKGNDMIVSRLNNISRKVDIMLKPNQSFSCYSHILQSVSCIIVDEAQFLTEEQVKELVVLAKQCSIDSICYGLLTDFQGEFFPGSAALVRYAEKREELKAMCHTKGCGQIARYNARKSNGKYVFDGEQVLIGADESYDPLCLDCYLNYVLLPHNEEFQHIQDKMKTIRK